MRKYLFLLIPLAFMSCSKDKSTGTSTLEITKFEYEEIPSTGGSVTPTYEYKYKVGDKEMTSGASVVFTGSDSRFTVDQNTGTITAQANTTGQKITFTVDMNVSRESAQTHKTITVIQNGTLSEDIVKSETVQLPLVLAPHKCVYPCDGAQDRVKFDIATEYEYWTTRTDGKTDRDFKDQFKVAQGFNWDIAEIGVTPEYVSAKGIDLKISGGDWARIDTYKSGKKDTTIIEKATFETKTVCGHNVDADKTQLPSCSYSNGIWKINQIGGERAYDINHTISATANGHSTTLRINQNKNYPIETLPCRLNFISHRLVVDRDAWPNFEDYPVGSSPKWPTYKDIDPVYGDPNMWHNPKDTRDFHPDGNRYLGICIKAEFEIMNPRNIYISGALESPKVAHHYPYRNFLRGGVKITATANVKMKDGSTKKVEHVSEWIQDDSGYYKGRSCPNGYFGIKLPVVEGAVQDFVWKVNFSFTFNGDEVVYGTKVKDGNLFDYPWNFPELTFKDCLSTVKEYQESKNLHGIFVGSFESDWLGDIIDGVEQEYEN